MQSQVGSASRWSINFVLQYSGPPISSPFSATAPNPTNTVPAPEVNMQGQISARYRLDPASTISFGTGLTVYTPFNGAKGWSVADPYIYYNHLFKFDVFRSYLQAGPTLWTDNQYYTEDGYRVGLFAQDETYHVFKSGLTLGLSLWVGGNFFSSAGGYDPGQQDVWYLGGGPYAELELTKSVSLRSVFAVQGDNTNANPSASNIVWENPYQTLGVAVQIIKQWYVYVYAQASPYSGNFTAKNTGIGFNMIVNLF